MRERETDRVSERERRIVSDTKTLKKTKRERERQSNIQIIKLFCRILFHCALLD